VFFFGTQTDKKKGWKSKIVLKYGGHWQLKNGIGSNIPNNSLNSAHPF